MSRPITVITPENIEVTYEAAGFASRFVALLVDLAIQIACILLVQYLVKVTGSLSGALGAGLGSLASATGTIVVYLLFFAYATVFEMLWGGRTPGKRLLGLRVIRDGGYPITLMSSALRNILRFMDFGILPLSGAPVVLCGLPGVLCIFFSPTYKRIGDYAAGTIVIVEGYSPSPNPKSTSIRENVGIYMPFIKNLDRLTEGEYRLIRRFTARRRFFALPIQSALAERIALPLMEKLDIRVPAQLPFPYADILEALERRYAEEYGIL